MTEPARFLGESVHPLQTIALHPNRSLGGGPRQEVECCTDSEGEDRQSIGEPLNFEILFGGAQAHRARSMIVSTGAANGITENDSGPIGAMVARVMVSSIAKRCFTGRQMRLWP